MILSKSLPLISVLCTFMAGAALSLGNYPLLPSFFLIPIYYWLIYRPDLLPLWLLCFIGLFYDALFANEIGISSVLLMGSFFLGQYVKPLLRPDQFYYIWGGYVFYSFGYLFLYALLTSRGFPILISWIYGILFYPLVARGLNFLHLRLNTHD